MSNNGNNASAHLMKASSNPKKSNVNIPIYGGKEPFGSLNAFDYYGSLQRIRESIENDQLFDLTLGKAAKIARYEPKYFSTFFRQKVGISFVVWRTGLRVSKARELIMGCDHSLAYVCSAAGFGNMRTFERAFKKYTGKSPREYKQNISRAIKKKNFAERFTRIAE
jgi:AraC-like DNA-binding protein